MANENCAGADAAPQLTRSTACASSPFSTSFCTTSGRSASRRRRRHGPVGQRCTPTWTAFPHWLNNLLAHGYLSTSFFFLLSGFILAYLYWTPSGELSTTRQRFWWQRFTRIYPVHLIALALTILLTLPRFLFDPNAPSIAVGRGQRRRDRDADAGLVSAAGTDLELADLGVVGGGVPLSHHAVADARAGEALAPAADRVAGRNAADLADADAGVPAVLSRRRRGPAELADLHRQQPAVLGGALRGRHADVARLRASAASKRRGARSRSRGFRSATWRWSRSSSSVSWIRTIGRGATSCVTAR